MSSITQKILKAIHIHRQATPLPCANEIIPVNDWCIVVIPQGTFEGMLRWKQPEWGKAGVDIEVSWNGEYFIKRVTVYEANIRRMSCWLEDATATPHIVDNYIH